MARIDNLSNFLTDIADSIRSKKGTTDKLSPENFDTEIEGIETGNGSSLVTTHFTIDDFTQISSNYTFENDEMICTVPASGVWGGVRLNEPQNGDYHLKLTNNATKGQRIWYMYKEDDIYMYVLCIGSGDGQEGIRYKLSKTTRGTSKIDKLTFPYTPKLNDVLNINVSGSSQIITCNGYTIATLSDCDTIGASIGDNADNAVPFSVFSEFYRVSKKQIKIQTKEITITENGTQSVTPDEGYDGLEKVNITTNIPSGGDTPTKGFTVNEWNSDGLPTKMTLIGFDDIPQELFKIAPSTNNNSRIILGYLTDITLPLDLTITTLKQYTFYKCKFLQNINLPDTITTIENDCFYDDNCLVLQKLPNSLITIGDRAFGVCSQLSLTVLPSGVQKIGIGAFYNCANLSLTELPRSIQSIGAQAFYACTKLAITELPDVITEIANETFRNCTKMNLTKLPTNLAKINTSAFYGCSSMALSTLPDTISSIGGTAFYGCTKLSITKLPTSLTSLTTSVFSLCTSIKKLMFPNIVSITATSIYNSPFYNCTGLKKVWFGSSITSAGFARYTFATCKVLEKIYIDLPRATVEKFTNYQYAFMNDTSKTGIIVCNDDEEFITKEEFDVLEVE